MKKFAEREMPIALNHHKEMQNQTYTEPPLLSYFSVKSQKFENILYGQVVRHR